MTKKFDVIPLDGFIYLVDKAHNPAQEGDIFYREYYPPTNGFKKEIITVKKNSDYPSLAFYKVIASNNPSIDVPQINADILEVVEMKNIFKKHQLEEAGVSFVAWSLGYKAAKAKKYDEGDMRKLMDWAWSWFRSKDESKFQEFLKSLTKPIKSITIEMDSNEEDILYEQGGEQYKWKGIGELVKPKLDKDGKVIIKEVEYE